jgi:hypothetical protein
MSDRRSFLVGAGASILVASVLTEGAQARIQTGNLPSGIYIGGLVSDPALPGLSGQLLLNVYLSVENGTGVGTISDPVHPQVNSHVEIRQATRDGNEFQFDGEVILSNDPARVGQQVLVIVTVHGDATSLVLELGGETFSELGITTTNPLTGVRS